MAEKVSTVFNLPSETFRRTLDQLHDRASSIISLSLQWKDFDQDFASLNNAFKERAKALHSAQESLERKLEDVKNRESRLDEKEKAIEDRERDFKIFQEKEKEDRKREVEGIEKSRAEIVDKDNRLNEKTRDIEAIEKELRLKEEQVQEKRKELDEKFKDMETKEKMIQEWGEEVELEKIKYEKLCKEVELKQKQLEEVNHGLKATVDGKAMQSFSIEHSREIDSMRLGVSMALRHSKHPPLLVLDALQGFYLPHLKKGNNQFEVEIVRRSCSLLLEELMKLSPDIWPHVKKEARKLALDWVKNLKPDADFLEVLCFLQLLACYGLASSFKHIKLLAQLEVIANHSLAPALFRALGLTSKVSDFVQNLIIKKKLNEAIKFIYEFGMVGQFQPVSLLNDFLERSKIATENLRKRNETLEGQINASKKRLTDINYALRCIEEHKIDYGPTHKSLEQQVGILEKEISKRNEAATLEDKIQKLLDEKDQHSASAVPGTESATSSATASTAVSATTTAATQPQQLSGNKRPREDVSAEKNVKDYHGADQASEKISEREISERKAAASVGNEIRKLHDEKGKPAVGVVVTSSATSSGIASTSVSAAATPPQQSGNKRLRTNASMETNLNASHDANQVTIDVSSKTNLPSESNASASLGPQPKPKSLSVNPNKEELKRLLDMREKSQIEDSEIAAALRSAHDPGKLVLDIMNVPVPFMPDGREDFKVKMLKSSCILLLRQLRAVAPEINPEIRDEAKKFALYWETILTKRGKKSPVDIICFLQFLASFELGSVFKAHELLNLLENDHWCKVAPDLCKDLSLADKIPSYIENRIKQGQYIEAVKYIYALNVVDKFPPVSVLKDSLSRFSKKSGKRPLEVQIVDIDKEIKSLEDVVKCVADYKITGLSAEKLKERIAQLEKEKRELKTRQASAQRSSATGTKGKLKLWPMNKRPRAHGLSDYHKNRYYGGKPAMNRHTLQHPSASFVNQNVPYSPPRHHVLPAAYPPHDFELDNYGSTVTPSYHWNALGDFGPDRPFRL